MSRARTASVVAGAIKVHRVVCAIDCGTAVNPNVIAQQMESSVVFALTAALYGKVDIKDGVVQQGNFPAYPMLRLAATPVVETSTIPSNWSALRPVSSSNLRVTCSSRSTALEM